MREALIVGAGGALGSVARFLVAEFMARLGLDRFPWATLLANLSGCLLMGIIVGLLEARWRALATTELRLFLTVGLCGGYTTMSAFALQTLILLERGDQIRAALNLVVTLLGCLAATALGLWLTRTAAA